MVQSRITHITPSRVCWCVAGWFFFCVMTVVATHGEWNWHACFVATQLTLQAGWVTCLGKPRWGALRANRLKFLDQIFYRTLNHDLPCGVAKSPVVMFNKYTAVGGLVLAIYEYLSQVIPVRDAFMNSQVWFTLRSKDQVMWREVRVVRKIFQVRKRLNFFVQTQCGALCDTDHFEIRLGV